MMEASATEHYVYIYRNKKQKIRYVGYGKSAARSVSTQRSPEMLDFIRRKKYTVEIAGPYGTEAIGKAVETALISSLHPDLNSPRAPGAKCYQFRPVGVPAKCAERLSLPHLQREDLRDCGACPALFVQISERDFDGKDKRKGYLLHAPLPDKDLVARMEKWWQLGRHVEAWEDSPEESPVVLIAVAGPTLRRVIIASVLIDAKKWSLSQSNAGLYQVPLIVRKNLDAFGLRGRIISPDAGIKFGAITPHFFAILDSSGKIIGRQN